jgi:hypothetical protein
MPQQPQRGSRGQRWQPGLRGKRRRSVSLIQLSLGLLLSVLVLPVVLPALPADATDDLVYDRVMRALVNDPDLKTDRFEVEVKDGVVTVRGQVSSEKLKQRVTKVAKKAKGVKEVINEVEVRL